MVKDTMELEGLLLVTCTCCKGDDTELYAINLKTPMTNCFKEMLDDKPQRTPNATDSSRAESWLKAEMAERCILFRQ